MKFGYHIVREMCNELLAFMEKHKFERLSDFKGHSMQYFTTHADLVARQAKAREAKKAEHERSKTVRSDGEWKGDDFVKQTDALARG
jgi:dihydropyrimidine dehydrogenase (NADP+)/dihydropyrimidine dehydrogenase (NAD+) subunit PreA